MEDSMVQNCLTFSALRPQLRSGSKESSVQTQSLKSDQQLTVATSRSYQSLPRSAKQSLSSFQPSLQCRGSEAWLGSQLGLGEKS